MKLKNKIILSLFGFSSLGLLSIPFFNINDIDNKHLVSENSNQNSPLFYEVVEKNYVDWTFLNIKDDREAPVDKSKDPLIVTAVVSAVVLSSIAFFGILVYAPIHHSKIKKAREREGTNLSLEKEE